MKNYIKHHNHHEKAKGNLLFTFICNFTFNIIVIFGGLVTNSMAILADCMHDLTDTFSIGIAYILEKVSSKDKNNSYTYGYQRFSILGAVLTSVFVIVISFFVLFESIQRLFAIITPDAQGMLAIAILGIIFKGISVYKLHGGITFNEKAILFHLLSDIFEWIAILIISVILMFYDIPYLDPLVSIGISLWLIYNLSKTLYKSLSVFLQKVPHNFNIEEIKEKILDITNVEKIEDFHIWSLDGIESVVTLKLKIKGHNENQIKEKLYDIFFDYDVVDLTVEFLR